MKNIIFAAIISSVFLLYSCQSNKDQRLLKEALLLVDNDPEKALLKLDSIQDPKGLDTDSYMQYIVTRIQGRDKTYKDITRDSLILSAANYFEKNKNYKNAALANYYAGNYYIENDIIDSSFFRFKKATDQANLTNDTLLLAKSNHSIAHVYFNSNKMDSAIVYNKKALKYYRGIDKISTDIQEYTLNALISIDVAYRVLNLNDSAYVYAKQGLKESENYTSSIYKSKFKNDIGAILKDMGEYNEAKHYLYSALPGAPDLLDSTKIYLNLSTLYCKVNEVDSMQYYKDIIIDRIPNIKDKYTLKSIYSSLADFSNQNGDYKQTLYYSNLEKEISKKIEKNNYTDKLLKVDQEYKNSIQKLEQANTRKQIIFYVTVGILLLVFLSIVVYLRFKSIRFKLEKERKEKQLLEELYLTRVKNITATQTVFKKLSVDWDAIEKEVDALAIQFNAQKPTIYNQIRFLIADIKDETDKQLTGFVQDLLVSDGYTGDFSNLSKKDLLLTGFCYMKLSNNEISKLINISTQRVYPSKLNLKHKLKDHGLTDDQIESILFDEKKEQIE